MFCLNNIYFSNILFENIHFVYMHSNYHTVILPNYVFLINNPHQTQFILQLTWVVQWPCAVAWAKC